MAISGVGQGEFQGCRHRTGHHDHPDRSARLAQRQALAQIDRLRWPRIPEQVGLQTGIDPGIDDAGRSDRQQPRPFLMIQRHPVADATERNTPRRNRPGWARLHLGGQGDRPADPGQTGARQMGAQQHRGAKRDRQTIFARSQQDGMRIDPGQSCTCVGFGHPRIGKTRVLHFSP